MHDSPDSTGSMTAEAFGERLRTVNSFDVVARVTAQSCRQSGLSVVVQELLDFDGDEIYFEDAAPLVGRTFREALLAQHRAIHDAIRARDPSAARQAATEHMLYVERAMLDAERTDDWRRVSRLRLRQRTGTAGDKTRRSASA